MIRWKMTLEDIEVLFDLELTFEHDMDIEQIKCRIDGMQILQGIIPISAVGFGKTKKAAQRDYAKKIAGKKAILHTGTNGRQEINIPETLK